MLERARALAESTDHQVALSAALGHLASTHLIRGSFRTAAQEAEKAVEVARRLGDPLRIEIWTLVLGIHRILVGDWQGARRQIEGTIQVGPEPGVDNVSPYRLMALGWLELVEGAWVRAAQLLDQSLRIAERTGNLQPRRYATHLLAQLDVLTGYPDRAIVRLNPLLDGPGLEELDVTTFLPCLAWAHLELHELDEAEALAVRTVERARQQLHALALADGLRVLGMVFAQRGRWPEAERALEEGRRLAHSLPHPYAEARTLHEQGILELGRGDVNRARERFAEALAFFQRLGARKDVERTERMLKPEAVPRSVK